MSLLLVFFVLIFSLTAPWQAQTARPDPEPAPAPAAAEAPEPAAPAAPADPWGLPEPLPRPVTRSILALTSQGEPDPGLVAAPRKARPRPARQQTLLRLVTASRPVAAAALPAAGGSRLSELLELVDRELGSRQGMAVEPAPGGGVLVRLDESITFDQGRSELKPAMGGPLGRLAAVLAERPGWRVVVTGHTDDVPINTPRFASNWELSAARAAAVARALMARGAERTRFTIRGLADTHPRAANDTPAQRSLNRRVEIELRPRG
jgi:chemotaxis protein MotB